MQICSPEPYLDELFGDFGENMLESVRLSLVYLVQSIGGQKSAADRRRHFSRARVWTKVAFDRR